MGTTAAELDTAPNAARAYDHLLRDGGQDSVTARRPDRLMAERLQAAFPPGAPGPWDLVIANCIYQQRAVRDAVHSGSRQILILGAGFPWPRIELRGCEPVRPLHEVAKTASPDARVAYVDWDMLAFSHNRAATAGVPGVSCAHLDLANIPAVRTCPDVTGTGAEPVIDWGQKLTIVFGLVLHYWPADQAKTIIDGYLHGLRPGSRVVITVPWHADEGLLEKVRAVYQPVQIYNHTATQVQAMLRGMQPLGNGVEVARGPAEIVGREAPVCVLAGVGLV